MVVILLFFSFILLVFMFGCATTAKEKSSRIIITATGVEDKNISFGDFKLPIPEEEEKRNYLGISGQGNFEIPQIETQILIIEIFSMYCPHCQKEAPGVNELYKSIQERVDLKDKIKIIGIGATNSAYEVSQFKKTYEIPFPLFPDEDISISRKLGASSTPTFIAVKFLNNGDYEIFYFKSGSIGEIPQFLQKILELSELQKE
jgi:thiol-disulfide isomerase/thioredoxin